MIDVSYYKRAIQWLQRNMSEHLSEPENQLLLDGLTHSFEATYNLTESVLRQALARLSDDTLIPGLSSGEFRRFAADEGVTLSSPHAWLQYGLAIEQANERIASEAPLQIFDFLPQYIHELGAFTKRLEGRLVPVAA